MKYKLLTIADKDLVTTYEREGKLGYEFLHILDKITPNASSDFVGWRMMFVNKGQDATTKKGR